MISLKRFNQYLKVKGLSDKTLSLYNQYLQKLNVEKLSSKYLLWWLERNNNSIGRATLKNLFQYIKTQCPNAPPHIRELVLTFDIPKMTGTKKKREFKKLTREEVHKIAHKMTNDRNKFMVLVSYYCGLRSAELLNIRYEDIDWEKGLLKVIGKGNKERTIPIPDPLLIKLAEYVNKGIDRNPDFDYLFKMRSGYWRSLLYEASKKAIGIQINPHALRHNISTHLYKQGLGLKELAEFLGHASVSTTQIYTHIDKDELNKKVRSILE